MGACWPIPALTIVLALQPQLQRIGPCQRRQYSCSAKRIVTRRDDIAGPQRVGLIFLIAREAEGRDLGILLGEVAERTRTYNAAKDRAKHAEDGVAGGSGFSLLRMVCSNVTGLMTKDKGELRLIVHQTHQLASDVDIAARNGEGVFDRAVEGGEMIDLAGVVDPREAGDSPADALYIGCPRPGLGPPYSFPPQGAGAVLPPRAGLANGPAYGTCGQGHCCGGAKSRCKRMALRRKPGFRLDERAELQSGSEALINQCEEFCPALRQ